MQTRRTWYLVMTVVAALSTAAYTDNDPVDAGSAPLRTPSTEASEPTGEPDGDQVPTTTEARRPTTDPADNQRNGGTAPPAGPALPFPADTRPDTSAPAQGSSVLVRVERGEHPGYVRYVFHFEDHSPEGMRSAPAQPAWDVRYVPRSEVVQDGSGFPVRVEGAAVLRIAFEGAAMHWEDGSVSLRHSRDAYDRLRLGGDFEGYVTWFLGLDGERPFRAFSTDAGTIVVDVVTP